MKLTFEYRGIRHSVESIIEFAKEGVSAYWSDPVFRFFPELEKEKYMALPKEERKAYLTDFFTKFELENRALISEKIEKYNEQWNTYEAQIIAALQEAFDVDLADLFNDMRCFMTFNPISPRYLEKKTFDVFYLNSEKGALGIALHEIIHFVWFYVWNQVFKDSYEEYETPHLKWILSEMVVDAVMADERLALINPYYLNGACVYSYFYTMQVGEKPILDTMRELYRALPIKEFMEKSYRYCMEHEDEIRKHIKESERGEG